MHELSIAQSLIELASEAASEEGAEQVEKIRLRIGELAGVVSDALRFSFDVAAEGTVCDGATLEIEDVPVTVMCSRCRAPRPLATAFTFVCPECGAPTAEILSGKELELVSIEVTGHAAAHR